jgi:hypothetical protein
MNGHDNDDWGTELMAALGAVPGQFPPGALAYLTATSKVEFPVRDAVASFLHTRHGERGLFVAREWRERRDLAVLDTAGNPVVQLEAKALYGFDVSNQRTRTAFLTGTRFGLAKDAASLAAPAASGQACFLLTILTHPMGEIPHVDYSVVKYAAAFNRALRVADGDPEVLLRASERWSDDLLMYGRLVGQVRHEIGPAFGVGWVLDCHLVQLPASPAGGASTVAAAAAAVLADGRESVPENPATAVPAGAAWILLTPPSYVQGSALAVIADDTKAIYLEGDGQPALGLDAARTEMVARMIGRTPTSAREWLDVALCNIGIWEFGPVIDAPTFDTAVEQALAAAAGWGPEPPSETREERMFREAQAAYAWSQLYPVAADGEVDDPDADLALAQMMLPPVDPTQPHTWMPLGLDDVECGFCGDDRDGHLHRPPQDVP